LCRPGQTESAPSNLPKETAIKVRIAEFFVHHASREEEREGVVDLLCWLQQQTHLLGDERLLLLQGKEGREMKRKDVAESGFGLGGGGNARTLLVHPGPSWKVNIQDPSYFSAWSPVAKQSSE
jgi:hypothetical protein